jgi:flagellar biosynthesis/type III secretory pathway chaperone
MGKLFEAAKLELQRIEEEKGVLLKQLYELDQQHIEIEREWYGISTGDVLGIHAFERLIKAAKRWRK